MMCSQRKSSDKDLKKIMKRLEQQGWRIEHGKHFKCHHPKGGFVMISGSPRCPWVVRNVEADIKKIERLHAAGATPEQFRSHWQAGRVIA